MPAAQRSIVINRPIDEVWAFVTDGSTAPRWRPGVLDVAKVSGQGASEIWKQGAKGPGGRRIDADYEVTAWEPGSRMAFRAIAGPVRPTGEYLLEDVDGATRITFSLQAELGGIQKLLMGGMVQRTMDAEVGALANLKRVLEAS